MPLYGTLDLTTVANKLPTLANLDTEAWTLPKAEVLQLLIEVPRSSTDGLLPKAMHPALPSYVILALTKYSESPVGPFTLAMLRLGTRAGAHPRGLLLGAAASSEAAAKELRARWGFPIEAGEVKLLRCHDRVNWVTAANAPIDCQTRTMLIQVDPKYTFYKAERGKPQVSTFDAAAWNAPGLKLAEPIIGTCCTVDTDLPRIRFVMDPLKPVFQGTRRIRESRVEE